MKLSITVILIVAALITGYLIGSFKGPADATLYILILSPDGSPMSGLEVDLWYNTTLAGPPDAGVSLTNSSGIAVFSVQKGGYLIGFNLNNFPATLESPEKMPVSVFNEFNNATVNLHNNSVS